MIWRLLQALSLFAAADASAGIPPNTKLHPLNTVTFQHELSKPGRKSFLVMFHVDWCQICQVTLPLFSQAYDKVKGIQELNEKVVFAQVDSTSDKTLVNELGIEGYPAFKWFPSDKHFTQPLTFKNSRTVPGFVSYVKRMTQPAVLPLTSEQDIVDYWKESEMSPVFIQFGKNKFTNAFEDAAERFQDKHMFFFCDEEKDCKEPTELLPHIHEVEKNSIAAVTPAERQISKIVNVQTLQNPSKSTNLTDWVSNHRYSGIWELGASTFFDFTHGGKKSVVVVYDPKSGVATETSWYKDLNAAQEKHNDEFYFGVLNGAEFEAALAQFSIYPEELPRLLVLDKNMERFWEDFEHMPINEFEKSLQKVLKNEIHPQQRSIINKLFVWWRGASRNLDWQIAYAQQGIMELLTLLAIWIVVLICMFVGLVCLGRTCLAVCRALSLEDEEVHLHREYARNGGASGRRGSDDKKRR